MPSTRNKTYHVIVLGEGGKTVRKWNVSSRTLRVAGWTAAALGVAVAVVGIALGLVASKLEDVSSRGEALAGRERELKEKLQASSSEVRSLEAKITSLSSGLDRMSDYARKLRRFTHLSDPERHLAIGPVSTTGDEGEETPAPADNADTSGEKRALRVELLGRKLSRLTAEAAAEEKQLKALEEAFRRRGKLLSSTPSIWPARGMISSPFGMRRDPMIGRPSFHKGLDIYADPGSPVMAPADGLVVFAGAKGAYGNCIILDHGFGVTTRYAHLSGIDAKPGQRVERGRRVGAVGSSGRSTGPHLHYEVRLHGVAQDPTRYILD